MSSPPPAVHPKSISKADFEKNESRYKDYKIVVYCTIGYRSGLYVSQLKRKGFEAYNLKGGVLAWADIHEFFVDPSGKKTNKVHVYGPKWNLLPQGYEAVW